MAALRRGQETLPFRHGPPPDLFGVGGSLIPAQFPGTRQAGIAWLPITKTAPQRSKEYTPRDASQRTEVTPAAPAMFQIPQVVNASPHEASPYDFITKPPKFKREPGAPDRSAVSKDAPGFFQIEDSNEQRRQQKQRYGQVNGNTNALHQKLIYGGQVLMHPEPLKHTAPFEDLEKAHSRFTRRQPAYRNAAFDLKHLPITPPGGTRQTQGQTPKENNKRVEECVRAIFDSTVHKSKVHDVGKYPFKHRNWLKQNAAQPGGLSARNRNRSAIRLVNDGVSQNSPKTAR